MSRPTGRAARRAIDPDTFVSFIDVNTAVQISGDPRRIRKLVNGHPINQANEGRMLRRWRSGAIEGITQPSAERFLAKFGLTLNDFTLWALMAARRTHVRNNEQENTSA